MHLTALCLLAASAQASLIISEYVEGSKGSQALEIFNGGAGPEDLNGHVVEFYMNGAATPETTIELSGVLAAGAVHVVGNAAAANGVTRAADELVSATWFNGDDAIVLRAPTAAVLDSIGQIGVDPGRYWGTNALKTKESTLRRIAVAVPDTDPSDAFDPSAQWAPAGRNDFSGLGAHAGTVQGLVPTPAPTPLPTLAPVTPPPPTPAPPTPAPPTPAPATPAPLTPAPTLPSTPVPTVATAVPLPAAPQLLISEYIEGSGYNKAIELYNAGIAPVSLGDYRVKHYANGNLVPTADYALAGTLAPGAVWVVVEPRAGVAFTAVANQLESTVWFNGDDAVVLEGPGGVVVDSIGQIGVDPGSYWGTSALKTQDMTLRRAPGAQPATTPLLGASLDGWVAFAKDDASGLGWHTDAATPAPVPAPVQATPVPVLPTPEPVTLPPVGTTCGSDAIMIHDIQGTGAESGLLGLTVTVEGVVTLVSQGTGTIGGFFLQEEDAHADADPATSEGIFVSTNTLVPAVGDVVRVRGVVSEYYGATRVRSVSRFEICESGALARVAPLAITLPMTDAEGFERYEGMRVVFEDTLTVTNVDRLGQYGEVVLANSMVFKSTNVHRPGPECDALAAANALATVVLDDAKIAQFPEPALFPNALGLSAGNRVRRGDLASGVTGVVDWKYGAYRVQTTEAPEFVAVPRPEPQVAFEGMRVASFNVLNYFNGDGLGGGFPAFRGGADTVTEFERQRAKTVRAIVGLNAHVVGLVEVENDGFGELSAIADIVNGVNAAAPAGHVYSVVRPAGLSKVGNDDVAVGLIYRSDVIAEVGTAAVLTTGTFAMSHRRPLAQAFQHKATGETVVVAVNHFKAKSGCPSSGADADQGDGQGCFNAKRMLAAEEVAAWMATHPTGARDDDILIIGDLNAYAKEDPIVLIENAGYTNLEPLFAAGGNAYSYQFQGEAGALDHALATASLTAKVARAAAWHINADEPKAMDYNMEQKTPTQLAALYAADAFRSADHDPLVVDINCA